MNLPLPAIDLTILNRAINGPDFGHRQIVGDARSMEEVNDGEFDVVYSNSVIEHVGGRRDQELMAQAIQRVGHRFFVQTPNLWFPLEAHALVPGFQFLPVKLRAKLLQHRGLGHLKRQPDFADAEETVRCIRLLTKHELVELFPGAMIRREHFAGMTKSLMAIGGW